MFRTALRLGAFPLRGGTGQSIPSEAWNGAWRRLFTSQSSQKVPGQSAWQKSGNWQALRGTTRFGAPRPRYGAAQGVFGSSTRRGFRFSAWRRGSSGSGQKVEESLSLAGRLKKLSREYGWSAVGVYLGLSVLDFPFCFLLVRIVGVDKIGKLEHWVVSGVSNMIPDSVRDKWHEYWQTVKTAEVEHLGDDQISDKVEMVGWGVEEAQVRNKEEASLATQLALAYAIHKSFIFIRVPLTAAVTPKVVKVLRSWGWNIGKRAPRSK